MTKQRSSSRRRPSRRQFLQAAGAGAVAGLAGCAGLSTGGENTVTIFHAGSLAAPFEAGQSQVEDEYGVSVNREAKGSVDSTRKITEKGRAADVLGVSDFRLIRDMVMGEYGDWYGVFATNAMTVAYTDQSKYADEFGTDTWFDVLSRDDVSVAHSDPAADPNGYRSVMAMQLGAVEFEGERLYDESTRDALIDNAKITSGTETDLLGQLSSGELDYAWEYTSAGASHDVQTIDMPPHVNLAKATDTYAEHYAKAEVNAGGNTFTGAPIAYGITVPSVAENAEGGTNWVEFFASEPGQQVLTDNGFSVVSPIVVPESGESAVPDAVMENATAKSSIGPMGL
jgi:molybdate/tungstate transport system substrate-binding protein